MGFHNPAVGWSEFERLLAGRDAGAAAGERPDGPGRRGEDPPGRARREVRSPPPASAGPVHDAETVPYAELHAHSSFSFLDGASSPAELVDEAERLGLHALALTDHDGFYGNVRFAEAAQGRHVRTVHGAELSLEMPHPRTGVPDPAGTHLVVLARGQEGYHRLAAAITAAQLAGQEKGRPRFDIEDLAARAGGHWSVLTGCRNGVVRRALTTAGPSEGVRAAASELDRLVALFGADAVEVELTDHGQPLDSAINDVLAALAAERGLPVVATNNVHYATPGRRHLAAAMAAARAGCSLDELDGWLPAHAGAHLRSGAEMQRRFAAYPGALARTVTVADEASFPLRAVRPALPTLPVPDGHTPMSLLRELVWQAVPRMYPDLTEDGRSRIAHELDVIEEKDFPGYFLIVHGIVQEARRRGILCQGRGSAANSAVCYLLQITAVDAIGYDLPFERFLSSLREEEPDIDVDFDASRREEMIQWVYETYGRDRAAQVCNVIQYRPRGAIRDMARALGFSPGQQDAYARHVERWGSTVAPDEDHTIPARVLEYSRELLKAPRHLGIHSGGMVLTERPVGEVVPIEHARMAGRTVIQWDKDDAAWMGLVKFDLLGLGMLAALRHCFDLIQAGTGEQWELASIPKEEAAVYDMLCRADSIGVFQVESRAQMGLLPRLRPRRFYDLVIEIALIRPGPIQGGAVHPYVRRRLGDEPVTYAHPLLEPVLERTLGIPVFQEQLMQMGMAVGSLTGEDADLLRRAMGSKRGVERIESLRQRLYEGMAEHGLHGAQADTIYAQIQAFADFGFAESHSLSFALLVYASSWLKLHYPAAFLAGLLRAQPMGFYSPASLVADARRHGVRVRRPDLNRSGAQTGLEPVEGRDASESAAAGGSGVTGGPAEAAGMRGPTGWDRCRRPHQPVPGPFDPDGPDESAAHRRDGALAVRLGLATITGIGPRVAETIVAERERGGDYRDMRDLVRRTGLQAAPLEAMATAGAFDCLGLGRREALWAAGDAARDRAEFLPDSMIALQPPLFTDQSGYERLAADLWATGISTDDHPLAHLRSALEDRGVLTSRQLREHESGRRVEVAGLVTHRQRPTTASGVTFMNLEDEHGIVNVVCSAGVWKRHRRAARDANALIVRGMVERSQEGVVNLLADAVEDLRVGLSHRSRDFR